MNSIVKQTLMLVSLQEKQQCDVLPLSSALTHRIVLTIPGYSHGHEYFGLLFYCPYQSKMSSELTFYVLYDP